MDRDRDVKSRPTSCTQSSVQCTPGQFQALQHTALAASKVPKAVISDRVPCLASDIMRQLSFKCSLFQGISPAIHLKLPGHFWALYLCLPTLYLVLHNYQRGWSNKPNATISFDPIFV